MIDLIIEIVKGVFVGLCAAVIITFIFGFVSVIAALIYEFIKVVVEYFKYEQ